MPTIKNIGKQQRMVVDRFLLPGDSRYISPKRVSGFKGDPDFEIVDESPAVSGELLAFSKEPKVTLLKVQIVDDEPIQAQPEVDPDADASSALAKPARSAQRGKGKKKS